MAACDKSFLRFPIPAATAGNPHCTEFVEKRSRFAARCCHCESADKAKEFLGAVRALNPDATHNCWAFVAGPPGDTARIGFSDDGEPHGTAGRPMLNALLHSGVGEICVVVSRWFGGIKLGTGGLARAYQESVLANLRTLPLCERAPRETVALQSDYASLDALKRILPKFECSVINEDYGELACLLVSLPADQLEDFCAAAVNASNGRAIIRRGPVNAG